MEDAIRKLLAKYAIPVYDIPEDEFGNEFEIPQREMHVVAVISTDCAHAPLVVHLFAPRLVTATTYHFFAEFEVRHTETELDYPFAVIPYEPLACLALTMGRYDLYETYSDIPEMLIYDGAKWLRQVERALSVIHDNRAKRMERTCAALRIQRTWRRVSSNPNLPLGKRCIMRRFDEMQ